jgi:hypothetical protein
MVEKEDANRPGVKAGEGVLPPWRSISVLHMADSTCVLYTVKKLLNEEHALRPLCCTVQCAGPQFVRCSATGLVRPRRGILVVTSRDNHSSKQRNCEPIWADSTLSQRPPWCRYTQNIMKSLRHFSIKRKLSLSTPWRHVGSRGIAPLILVNIAPRPLYP